MLIDAAPQGATDKDESGLATLPDGWGTTLTGEPMPDVAAAVRRSRAVHCRHAHRHDFQADPRHNKFDIACVVQLSDIPTHGEVLAGHLDANREYRREWERTALARAVAVKVIAYRAKHGVSQAALAKRLGMSQPAIARLESGEHNPTFLTLLHISKTLEIELALDIAPSGHAPQFISSRARRNVLESFDSDGCKVLIAAT